MFSVDNMEELLKKVWRVHIQVYICDCIINQSVHENQLAFVVTCNTILHHMVVQSIAPVLSVASPTGGDGPVGFNKQEIQCLKFVLAV